MSILKLAFELFVIYILYKLIFEFIIPVYKTTKQVKQKISDMQQHMQQQQQNQQAPVSEQFRERTQSTSAPKRAASDDYIEYEEVK